MPRPSSRPAALTSKVLRLNKLALAIKSSKLCPQVANLAGGGARKMAKKGGTGQLQIEVINDDDWEALLKRKGLIVVDVYTDWCGPCVAMMSNLKKLKLEHGSDTLQLALANASNISQLERFRGRSEPTWLFVGTGQLLKVYYGSNAPALAKLVIEEYRKELDCLNGKSERKAVPWDEMTEDEIIKMEETEAKRKMDAERIKLEDEMAFDRVKRRNLERIARAMVNYTCIVFFPHAIVEADVMTAPKKRTCEAAYKLMVKYDTINMQIADQLDVTLTKDDVAKLLYNSTVIFPEGMLDKIEERPCIATLLQEMVFPPGERRGSATSTVSAPPVEQLLDVVEGKMAELLYGTKDPQHPKDDSIVKVFEEELENGVKAPPCWTPVEHISKSAALQLLFPHKVEQAEVPVEPVPPPGYIIIFEATRAHEILEAAQPFAEDVVHCAFFTSDNPTTAKKICHSVHELEKKPQAAIATAKMVIALKKSKSDPMLMMASLGPVYISPDLRTGSQEMDQWFPPSIEIAEEPDPWAPPPPFEPTYWADEEDNVYIEEIQTDPSDGVEKFGRRLIKLADGTSVENGEWKPIPPEEAELLESTRQSILQVEGSTFEVPKMELPSIESSTQLMLENPE